MKLHLLVLSILVLVISSSIHSQGKGFGLGIIIGEPTGLSAKYWTSSTNAFDFGLGYSFSPKNSRLHLHADYLFHSSLTNTSEKFYLYYGPGVRIKTREDDDSVLGIRGALGITWVPRNTPLDFFFEVVPVFTLIPATSFDINAGLGARDRKSVV